MQLKLIEIEELNSTNDYARELIEKGKGEEGFVVCTSFQVKGKGQNESIWESQKGKNLLLSLILKPELLPAEKYFFISMIAALGISNCLSNVLGIKDVTIKWPNDIYIASDKVAGILIQNDLNQKGISSSIIGIGLNVNQTVFSNALPNPVSLQQVLKREINLNSLREKLLESIIKQYQILTEDNYEIIKKNYESKLYRYNSIALFSSNKNSQFEGVIKGVNEYGKLLMEVNSELMSFDLKEITYLS